MLLKTLLIPLTCLATCLIPLVLAARKWKDGEVRLVGGGRRYRGTVLVYRKKRWGAICDSMWGLNDATVVCKQLGFAGAHKAPTRSKFGPGRRRKWLTRLRCSGTEKGILECPYDLMRTVGKHTCTGLSRSAGVVCIHNKSKRRYSKNRRPQRRPSRKAKITTTLTTTTPSTTTSTTTTTTTTTTTPTTTTTTPPTTTTQHIMSDLEEEIANWAANGTHNETLVELEDEDLIKDHEKTKNDDPAAGIPYAIAGSASAAEKEEKEAVDEKVTEKSQEPDKAPEKESEKVSEVGTEKESDEDSEKESEKDSDKESDKESDLESDKDSEKESEKESDKESEKKESEKEPEKRDEEESAKESEKGAPVLSDAPTHLDLELRLLGGRYPWEGRLEVREEGGKWGVICSDHWSMREVMVSCNQIGGIGMGKQALTTSYFGGASVAKHYYRIDCLGREDNLGKCNLTKSDDENVCSRRTNVAGIVCSHHLPDLVPHLKALELSARLQDQPLYYLRCSMEENCLSQSAYVLKATSPAWRNSMRRLFRFSTVVHNSGNADFRPYRGKNQWEWHACHMHYHSMEVFAHYDLMDSEGNRLAEGSKASFCLEDTVCKQGIKPKYNCRGMSDQGLSVNCSDNYMYDIDCQWIDVTDLKPGHYTFLLEVNPSFLVAESNFDNNVASCEMYYNGYYAHLRNCELQSLIDFREPRPIKEPQTGTDPKK